MELYLSECLFFDIFCEVVSVEVGLEIFLILRDF